MLGQDSAQLLEKLLQSGLPPEEIQTLMAAVQQDTASAEGDEDQPPTAEAIRSIYDVFTANALEHTSHTLQWLPLVTDDGNFEFNHFLIGTHVEEGLDAPNQLKVVKQRLPKKKLELDLIKSLKNKQDVLSKIQTVVEFPHEDEVIKARSMPQEPGVVASMTNTGVINLYEVPEIC